MIGLCHGRTATLLLALALIGCGPINWTRVTLNHPFQAKDVAFINPGETKLDDIVRRLGAPNDLQETPNGMIADYYYYDSMRFDVDFGWPAGFFLPPGASMAPHQFEFTNAGVAADSFEVAFDKSGVVQYKGFSHTTSVPGLNSSPFSQAP
jgi:hypothetical protein